MSDPAFLFYPGDCLQDLALLENDTQMAMYFRIMCSHMKRYVFTSNDLNIFFRGKSLPDVEAVKSILHNEGDNFFIPWVKESIDKRRAFAESRSNNRRKKDDLDSSSYEKKSSDMENENENEKYKKKKPFVPPTSEEFEKYFLDNGFSKELADRAWKGYDAAEWKDSTGKQIKNWKQKACHVWFKPENKITVIAKEKIRREILA